MGAFFFFFLVFWRFYVFILEKKNCLYFYFTGGEGGFSL